MVGRGRRRLGWWPVVAQSRLRSAARPTPEQAVGLKTARSNAAFEFRLCELREALAHVGESQALVNQIQRRSERKGHCEARE